jgi:phytoene synthase
VVSTTTDPRLGAIRLAWWRERLDELDSGTVPAEPRLQAVERELLLHGIKGDELSQLEDSWLPLLEDFPWGEAQAEGMKLRGRILFGVGARLLGAEPRQAEAAGEVWSLEDAAIHCSDAQCRDFLHGQARAIALPPSAPGALRSLTVLAAVASARTSGFARGVAALRHRTTGRYPRRS